MFLTSCSDSVASGSALGLRFVRFSFGSNEVYSESEDCAEDELLLESQRFSSTCCSVKPDRSRYLEMRTTCFLNYFWSRLRLEMRRFALSSS